MPGGSFHPEAMQTNAGEIIERRSCLGGIDLSGGRKQRRRRYGAKRYVGCGAVALLPGGRRRAGRAKPSSQSCRLFFALASVTFPAELTTREDGTRRGTKTRAKHQFAIAAELIFPAEATEYAEKIPTTADKLARVPRGHRGLGKLSGRLGRPAGKNANQLETLGPGAV